MKSEYEKLKLSYGREGTAHTANGKVTIYKTIIPEITIGDIKLNKYFDVQQSLQKHIVKVEKKQGWDLTKHFR